MVLRIDKPGTVRTVPLVPAEEDPQGLFADVALRVRVLAPDEREVYAREVQAATLLPEEARQEVDRGITERYLRDTVVGLIGIQWGDEPMPPDPTPDLVLTVLRQGALVQRASLAASAAQSPTRAEKNS